MVNQLHWAEHIIAVWTHSLLIEFILTTRWVLSNPYQARNIEEETLKNTWPPFFVDENVNIFVEANKKHVDNWTGMLKLVVEKLWCVPTTLPTFWKLSTSSQHYQLSKLGSNKNSERFSKVPFNKLILKNKLKRHHDPPFSIPFNRLTFHLCWDIGRNSSWSSCG